MRTLAWILAFLGLTSTLGHAQDIEEMLRKIKGAKKITAKVYVVDTEKKDETYWATITSSFSANGDLTGYALDLGGGVYGYKYSYTYDAKGRKTVVVQKTDEGALRCKSVYEYAADGSYTIAIQEHQGEKPGKEEPSDTVKNEHDAKDKLIVSTRHYKLFQVDIRQDYKYDGQGYLIEMTETGNGEKTVTTYRNDLKGNVLEKIHKDAKGGTDQRDTYRWDEIGNWTEHCAYGDMDKLSAKQTVALKYNERNNPVDFNLSLYSGGGASKPYANFRSKIEYEYYPRK